MERLAVVPVPGRQEYCQVLPLQGQELKCRVVRQPRRLVLQVRGQEAHVKEVQR